MTAYNIAKQMKIALETVHSDKVKVLNEVSGSERGTMGLTPDHIKQSQEWKNAYLAERKAFQEMREFNMKFSRTFKKEIRLDRRA